MDLLIENYEFLVGGGGLMGVGAASFFGGFKKLRTLRRIENTPTCNIRSMPMGSVEVKGVARMEEPLEAPFTGKAVAYYKVEIERYDGEDGWEPLHRDESQEPFFLDDRTGQVLVIPQGAEFRLRADVVHTTSIFSQEPWRLESYRTKHEIGRGFFGGAKLRFTERHIEVGQPVYVQGVAQHRPGLDLWRELMERVSEKLREVKANADEMHRLDLDGDGRISEDEWQSAHSRAVAEVRAEGIEDRAAIAQGSSGELFLISDRSEKDLVGRLRLESAGGVLAGGTAFIGGVVMLLSILF